MPLKDKSAKLKYDNEWKKKKRQSETGDELRNYQKEYMKKWRKNNPGRVKEKTYQERLEYNRAYNAKNKEKLSARKKEYYLKNKDYFKSKSSEWYKHNKERKNQEWKDKRELVLQHYGGVCSCCNEGRYEFLAIDHVNNDGNIERKTRKINVYDFIIRNNFPDNFQILCHNCNLSKAFYGYCPHQKERIKVA